MNLVVWLFALSFVFSAKSNPGLTEVMKLVNIAGESVNSVNQVTKCDLCRSAVNNVFDFVNEKISKSKFLEKIKLFCEDAKNQLFQFACAYFNEFVDKVKDKLDPTSKEDVSNFLCYEKLSWCPNK